MIIQHQSLFLRPFIDVGPKIGFKSRFKITEDVFFLTNFSALFPVSLLEAVKILKFWPHYLTYNFKS